MAYSLTVLERLGLSEDDLLYVPAVATVEEVEADEGIVERVQAGMRQAGQTAAAPMVGPNEKPRMLVFTSWMVHAGAPNANGDAFLADDLQARVREGLFQPPYFGMVDFNHSFVPVGVLFSSAWKYHEAAAEWGIEVQGAVFAWKFPELADTLLAEQSRHGFIRTSAAWMSKDHEVREDETGRAYLLHRNPVFFAHSLLDVPQADKDSRAVGSEDPRQTIEERERLLQQARRQDPTNEDVTMDQELLDRITALLSEQESGLRDAFQEALSAAETLPVLREELAQAQREQATLQASLDESQTALAAAQQTLAEQAEALAELDELRAYRTEVEEREAQAARTAQIESRLAQLPESFVEALRRGDAEVYERTVSRYAEMSDDEFAAVVAAMKEMVPATPKRKTLAERSRDEGALRGIPEPASGGNRIDRWK